MSKNPNWQPRTWRVVPLGPPGHFASQSSLFASHHQFPTRHDTMKVVIVLLATVAAVSAVKITNCGGSATVDFNNIEMTGCLKNKKKCMFPKGHDASMSLPFTPHHEVTAVKAKVTAFIGPIPIPFNLPNSDGCTNSSLRCPMPAGQQGVYTASLPIRSEYPSISLQVMWELRDQNNNKLVCIKFPVQVKN
ncbi:NPC intracellular cholesterol transporter 2 homolog a-like [Penaeus indicus]|uniref:NPC intracellular cholesterol transporter 2 homolog a-like n=1 Tax=Penaeus indicus TaxID=29960 RepID=UPI00300D24B5